MRGVRRGAEEGAGSQLHNPNRTEVRFTHGALNPRREAPRPNMRDADREGISAPEGLLHFQNKLAAYVAGLTFGQGANGILESHALDFGQLNRSSRQHGRKLA